MYQYKAFGLNIASGIALPELIRNDAGAPYDLTITSQKFECPELVPTQIFRRGIQAYYGQDPTGALYLHWDGVAAYRADKGNKLAVHTFTDDANLLSLFTVSEALGLILFQKSLLLLHASSVQVGEEAWCFMGEPGAGKSSSAAACIKRGCALLSDDLTAITVDEQGVPFVIPAYPQLKIWERTVTGLSYDRDELLPVSEGINKFSYTPTSEFPAEPVRLSKIFFLHKKTEGPELAHLSTANVPGELIKNFPLPSELLLGDYLKTHFYQSLQISAKVEIAHMRRPEGFENLEAWVREMVDVQLINTAHEPPGDIS